VQNREYKGFVISATAVRMASGGYGAVVSLRVADIERTFDVPLDEDLFSEDEALQEALHYGRDLADGLLPWFDPRTMVEHAEIDSEADAGASLRVAAA
jgi:hypothetical protein